MSLAFGKYEEKNEHTLGGVLWWSVIKNTEDYKVQQNIISKHFRILDIQNRRICSSFDLVYLLKRLEELNQHIK